MIESRRVFEGFIFLVISIAISKLFAQSQWQKYPEPVFEYGIATTVMSHENIYKMWYEANDGFGYATSQDGLVWTRDSVNYPILEPGPPGSWDENEVNHASVLIINNTYHMWYSGIDANDDNRIGHATSADGIIWAKDTANPVLDLGTTPPWDTNEAIHPSVIYDNNTFKMYYNGYGAGTQRILYAYSIDGSTWTGYTAHPMLEPGPSGSWDDWELGPLCVLNDGINYHLWYTGWDDSSSAATFQIGYAQSQDGLIWTRDSANPVLSPGGPGDWDSVAIAIPNVIKEGDLYKLWYGGFDGTNFRTGYATSFPDNITQDGTDITRFYHLYQNYPNPFNPVTTIKFYLPKNSVVCLKIFNILGEEITTLISERLLSGFHRYQWDATKFASGIYLYQLQAENYIETRKMFLIK